MLSGMKLDRVECFCCGPGSDRPGPDRAGAIRARGTAPAPRAPAFRPALRRVEGGARA